MGQIQGGWEYVWAAYAITWFALAAFAASLYVNRVKEK
jgi:heme exporter protein D